MNTLDLDFSSIRAYPPADDSGIIVLRLPSQDLDTLLATIEGLTQFLADHDPAGQLWIVEPNRVRIRRDLR